MERYVRNLDVKKIQNALAKGTPVDADVDGKGGTALHIASALTDEADCITVAEILLAHGANPNIQNYYGQSSLHITASYGYSRLLELLLVNGGDPLLGDIEGCSPIDYAYEKQQMEVVDQLNKLLDTENYECRQENNKKFVLSFWRQEVVEVPVASQEGPEVSCLSSDWPDGGQATKDIKKPDKKKGNEQPKCDSFLEESFSTRYSQFLRDLENYDHQKIDTDEDILRSLPILPEPKCVETNKSNVHSADFLKKLKQTIQRCQQDSDSDSDIVSLRRCLEKNLNEDSRTSTTLLSEDTFLSVDQTLNEFDIAQLTINLTDDVSSLDDVFDASYIPPNRQTKCSANLREQTCISEEACITLNSFTEDGSTFIEDTDNSTLTDSVIFVEEKNKINLDHNEDKCKALSKSNHNEPEECSVNVTAPCTFIPEECKTFNILKAPKKAVQYIERGTAPRNFIKPEECRTINMVKAPKKAVPYVERCIANNRLANIPSSKLFEELAKTYTLKKNTPGINPAIASVTPQKANHVTSIPGTLRSRQGLVGKMTPSTSSSCQSYFSVVEEFIYQDPEAGIALIERRCPTSSSIASLTSTGSQMGSLPRSLIQSKKLPEVLQNNKGTVAFEESVDSIGTVTNSIKALPADALRARLKELGCTPGPIIPGTQRVYQRHLMRLRKNPQMLQKEDDSKPTYPKEMKMVQEDPSAIDWMSWASLEAVMSSPFSRPDPLRHWRDGTTKSCFNYLLLDPRITQDLPVRGLAMTDAEKFRCFISAIFYIGKGSRGRPYYHLYEAIKSMENGKKKNKKIERIHDIWSEGVGVVSLHVFQNTIPVEAWTREAAMINAIGLSNLSNSIQGTFYGLPSTWRWAERRRLGTHLLWRALHIFLQEGERQLRPSDVTLPAWMK